MDEYDAPHLEVGFLINTGASETQVDRLATTMDRAERSISSQAALIERSTSNMVKLGSAAADVDAFSATASRKLSSVADQASRTGDAMAQIGAGLSGATAKVEAYGSAATRAEVNVARERKATAREVELMIARLERETAAIGKSKEARQQERIAILAVTAAQQGNTDGAERLQMAARAKAQAMANAAEEQIDAERRLIASREQEEQSLRSSAQAYNMNIAYGRQMLAAYHQQEKAAAAVAAENQRLAAAADQMKRSMDPAYAAQRRFDDEMGRARQLVSAGALGIDDYVAKLRIEQAALDRSTEAHRQRAVVQRFTASETLNISRQLQDVGVTAAMGMNPLMILVQQGPQIYDVLEQAKARGVSAGAALTQMGKDVVTYGVTGFSKLATVLTPANVLLGTTAVATVLVVRELGRYGEEMRRFEATAAGLGRTSGQTAQQMEAIAEAAAMTGDRSLTAARDSVNAFTTAGIQGTQTLTLLSANVERYAKLTGTDAAQAQTALAEAMSDPARAADTFTQQLGLLNGAQYEHIRQLAAQGDGEQATAELTRILTGDLAANANQTTGLAKVMDGLGSAVAGVATMFGRLDQRIRNAGAAYDEWLKKNVGGLAVDLFGTGNKLPKGPNANASRNQDQIAALNASQSLNTTGMKQFNDLLAQQRVLQKGLADTTGLTAGQVQALQHDYRAVTDTIAANRSATGAWITTQERAHLVAQAQAKLAGARTKADKAAAQQQLTRLQLGNQVLTQQERQTQAEDAYQRVASRYTKPKVDHHADDLLRQAKAMEAQIDGLYDVADAYGVSGSAALIAEARARAETSAILKRGEADEFVGRQIRLAVAQRVRDASASTAAMADQAAEQEKVNRAVSSGLIPAAHAAELLKDQIADLPLLNALEAARTLKGEDGTRAVKRATAALEANRSARDRLTDAQRKAAVQLAQENADDRLASLQEEIRLIGATDAARVHSMALFNATQQASREKMEGPAGAKWIATQVAIADGQYQLQLGTDAYNASLTETADKWNIIASKVSDAGRGMADAFGEAGQAIGGLASIFANYQADRSRAEEQHTAALLKAGNIEKLIAQENTRFALRSSGARVAAFGDMTNAAKGFFKEGSAGWKAVSTAEKAARAVEFALSVRSIAQDAIETGSKLASSAARTAANAVEAVTKAIASLPFPANIAAGAATVGALAAIGVSIAGSLGGGKNNLTKANNGTGTVLGSPDAQSESIRRALDGLKEVDLLMLGTSRQMAASLRSIEDQIGGVASLVVRAGNVNADVKVNEGFQKNLIGSVLSKIPLIGGVLGGLFGSKTETIGGGLYGKAQSLGTILNSGFDASYYSDVKKTSKFLGITTGTKYSTQYTGADAGLENQFTQILREFNNAIIAAAGPLGVATGDITSRLNGMVVDIGKIDLKGLSGEQIQEKLTAVFGATADRMASGAFPGFERFQKVGEGLFETVVRVSSTVEQVSGSLAQLGSSAKTLGIDAKVGLAAQFESLSAMTSAISAYADAFYTPAERNAAKLAQLGTVITGLGVKMPDTLANFRALVEAQDLNTAAGRAIYATLIQLAPAFAELKQEMDGAKSAADILAERQGLERQLLELAGNTAAIRELDLAKLDASNRALQQQVWAVQDAQAAAKAAEELRNAWSSVGDSIMEEVKRIRGLNGADAGGSYASLLGQFNATTEMARAGDQNAAKSLPGLSQALLKAAADTATSRQELDRVQAQTAASLEATLAMIEKVASTSGAASADRMLEAMQMAPGAASDAGEQQNRVEAIGDEIASLRREVVGLLADVKNNTGRVAKTMDTVTSNGADAISVVQAA
ncbi:MAG: phage tail length tape measure family protein [Sphingomonas phyllosphaerae]|uniref:phage tail length tape measure family protein n=1 Tax=Sphingomonas phyllosphaerae TaxID=257003 RepID=UPI002FF56D7A